MTATGTRGTSPTAGLANRETANMGKGAPRTRQQLAAAAISGAAAVSSIAGKKALHGATAVAAGTSVLREKAGSSVSVVTANAAAVRRSPSRHAKATIGTAKATAMIAKTAASGATDHMKAHVGMVKGKKTHLLGKAPTMEQLGVLAGRLAWNVAELQDCLASFEGNMTDASQHMQALLDDSGREDQLVSTSVAQATFSGAGELGLKLAPGRSGGAVIVEVERGSAAYAKPQLVPGLALIEVQGHTVQALQLKQINELLRTAGRPLQLRFQACRYAGEPPLEWYRALSRARVYGGAERSSAACGFLEVGEMVQAVEEPTAAEAAAEPRARLWVRRQRGGPIGWVALTNANGKLMLQSVSSLSVTGGGSATESSAVIHVPGSCSDTSGEAERLFSIDMLHGRVDEHASQLCDSTTARFQVLAHFKPMFFDRHMNFRLVLIGLTTSQALRELIDSREQELLEEIQE